MLADEILTLLETHVNSSNSNANESSSERHKQNSNPTSPTELEPGFQKSRATAIAPDPSPSRVAEASFPLGMVLEACPDILEYAKGGIASWRDFVATAVVVRAMLGISPSAWEEAQTVMGERQASTVVAAILQRGEAISNAGGYLRDLTRKAAAGQFSTGPMLMALIGGRKQERKRA